MSKKKIAVIFGGKSSEHDISRISASYVISQISREKYDIFTIGITKEGKWLLYSGDIESIKDGSWESHPDNKLAFIAPAPSVHGMVILSEGQCETVRLDVIFPVLHGKNGEDGTIQGLFEMSGIPYVGCGVLASADCMDKVTANIIFASLGIDQAKFTWCYAGDFQKSPEKVISEIESTLPYPIFVKPANAGSSVGISKAHDRTELQQAIETAAKEDSRILFEETIIGKEVECAVLGNDEPFASTVGEIAPASEFYDFDAKYNDANSLLFIPARIENEIIEKIRETAVKAYRAIGCSGLSRVDFFVTADNRIMLNEINTLPGFTSISMYPKLMEKSGFNGSQLVDKLIELAFERT